jgi:hypothetical protein
MVLINVKLSEDDQFFYATTSAVRNDALRSELVDLQNWRKRLQLAVLESEDLVKFGSMKEDIVEDELVNRIKFAGSNAQTWQERNRGKERGEVENW